MHAELTLEQIEGMAAQIVAEAQTQRERLCRLIRAEARIAHNRRPERFKTAPSRYQDEDGHWDNSYPPDQVYCDYTGPQSLLIYAPTTEDYATSDGFYYEYRTVTTKRGLRIAADGTVYTVDQTGTGRFGQFAAHPGECNVDVDLEYSRTSCDNLSIAELAAIESKLRSLAFPASVTEEVEA